MKKNLFRISIALITCSLFLSGRKISSLEDFTAAFISGYTQLNIPEFTYDYRDYFNAIPNEASLNNQSVFFEKEEEGLKNFTREKLKAPQQIEFDHLQYEIDFNLGRIHLEKGWVVDGRKVPADGLYELKNRSEWYSYFIKKFTSRNLSPEEIMQMGIQEVARVKNEMKKIQIASGFTDSVSFYQDLKSNTFYITDKKQLVSLFEKTDSTIRSHLVSFVGEVNIPPIFPMEWPNAGANTPPGIYLNHDNNAFGKDVFQYNFYGEKYNRRAIEWLYMHEAIPGHHLQFSIRSTQPQNDLQDLFLYPGNFEGWGCYVEYEGKELGVYSDPYSYFGKWEWDLVRSARLVIDAGIHNYGWSRAQALEYWKKTIPGQDDISEREVTRVTNWCAQVLSYKAGADFILQTKSEMMKQYGSAFDERKFHLTYLSFGMIPLEVIKKNFDAAYNSMNEIKN